MELNSNPEKKPRGNVAIADAGSATRFKPGQSGNPSGRPPRTPYADAHRIVADLPVAELGNSRGDSVAIRTAKAVAREAMKGKIPAAVEAANRTEGKPRESDRAQDSEERMDVPTLQKKIREIYGLPEPTEITTENLVAKNEGVETTEDAKNSPPETPNGSNKTEKKSRGNPGIVDAGVATRFKPGRSANPGGRPSRTPYADAYNLIADLSASNLRTFPDESVAIGIAKAVAREAMKGKIPAVVEAANRTEGKPRELNEIPIEKHDTAYMLKCIRIFYGLEDPEEVSAETIVARNGEGEAGGFVANNEDA